jgi:hypothetical protein
MPEIAEAIFHDVKKNFAASMIGGFDWSSLSSSG